MESARGGRWPAERHAYVDTRSARTVTRLTSHPSFNSHLPAPSATVRNDARELLIASARTGALNYFRITLLSGAITQLTERQDIRHPVAALLPDGSGLVFAAGAVLWAVDLETLEERRLVAIEGGSWRSLSLSTDGSTAVGTVKREAGWTVVTAVLGSGDLEVHEDAGSPVWHAEFHPDDAHRILVTSAAPPQVRLYDRRDATEQILYHGGDVLMSGARWLDEATIVFPEEQTGVRRLAWRGGAVGAVARLHAATAVPSRDGRRVVCKTSPHGGIQVADVATGRSRLLVSEGPGVGARDSKGREDPPPGFSPDGRRVFFTARWNGHAHVYVVNADLEESTDDAADG